MRIIQIELSERQPPIELHPVVSVVSGLATAERTRLVKTLADAARGRVPDCPTVFEAHDLLFDADPVILERLQLAGMDREPVIRTADLPRREEVPVDPDDDPEVALAEAEARLELAIAAEEAERAEARARAVEEAAEHAARREVELEAEIAQTTSDLEQASTEVEAREAEVVRLRRIRAQLDAIDRAEHDAESLAADLDAAEAELARLEAMRPVDIAPEVTKALSTAREQLSGFDEAAIEGLLEPGAEAALRAAREQLAAELDAPAHGELSVAGDVSDDARVRAAEAALATAREELAQAEATSTPLDLTPEQVAELEAAHRAVEEAEHGGRFAKGKVKKAESDLAEVLDRLGLPSYGAYLMRSSTMSIDPTSLERLRRLADAVAEAEGRLEAVTEMAIEARRSTVLDAAADEAAARVARIETAAGAVAGLLGAESSMSAGQLLVAADGALDRHARAVVASDAVGAERPELEAEVQRLMGSLDTRLAEHRAAMATQRDAVANLAAQVEAAEGGAVDLDRHDPVTVSTDLRKASDALATAQSAADAAEQQLRELRAALERESTPRVAPVASSAAAIHALAEARAAVDAARARIEARRSKRTAHGDVLVDDLEVYVLARLAGQRSAGRAGSIPLVVDGAFDHLGVDALGPVLRLIERMAPTMQMIVVSDDPELAAWADGLGLRLGMTIRA